jgi:hypothetical protein
MNNVANAKTSKQAEADWILGIGAVHDQGWESVRFMNISKNKLFGDSDSDPANKGKHAGTACDRNFHDLSFFLQMKLLNELIANIMPLRAQYWLFSQKQFYWSRVQMLAS